MTLPISTATNLQPQAMESKRKRSPSQSDEIPRLRLPPRPSAVKVAFPLPLPHPAAPFQAALDPASIAANQCRTLLKTQELCTSEDSVYTAMFGSQPLLGQKSRKGFIQVPQLGFHPPLPLGIGFPTKLQEASSLALNYPSLANFASRVVRGMNIPDNLSGAFQW